MQHLCDAELIWASGMLASTNYLCQYLNLTGKKVNCDSMDASKDTTGLTTEQATSSRLQNGSNTLEMQEDRVFLAVLKEVLMEPMFIILLAACIIYFAVGQYQEGFIMLVSIFIVAGISLFQEYRSKNAVQALKKISAAKAKVLRNGKAIQINTEEIVVNDVLLLEEGEVVAADGIILAANDFSINANGPRDPNELAKGLGHPFGNARLSVARRTKQEQTAAGVDGRAQPAEHLLIDQ